MHRTHTCGQLTAGHVGQEVTLAGWVTKVRDMGGLTFVDLRDRYGVTQMSFDPSNDQTGDMTKLFGQLKHEYVIKVVATVTARPDGMKNSDMVTGEIELVPSSIEILAKSKVLPFAIADDPVTSEETRLKYRYLDLRRRPVLKNIEFRARMNHFTRNWFTEQGFLEVQTPIFTVSSPEGARDYLIPSRVQPGKFYAMPQAPQQYKQLLMMGGVDKYFQVAPCFRDEDPRADRAMCEFYQVDLEMSFVEQDDVLAVLQGYALSVARELVPHKKILFGDEVPHISYQESMDRFGIDRPDLRFGVEIVDVSEVVASSAFGVFADTVAGGGVVRAIKLEGQTMTRKEIDEVTDLAKRMGAKGLAYLLLTDGEIKGPVAKFCEPSEVTAMIEAMGAMDGDMVFFAAGKWHGVCKVLHHVRMFLRDKYQLVNDDELAFCFVVDFPFYEYDEGNDRWDFGHNPFSHIVGGLEGLDVESLHDVQTHQYDLVLNGYELGSGSIRNNNPEVMVRAFEKVGLSEADVKAKFGAMYEAFQYGCPPHGGFAFGFDRLMMILCDEPNIREVYAFPKSGKAEDVMMGAPSVIEPEQLEELGIGVVEQE